MVVVTVTATSTCAQPGCNRPISRGRGYLETVERWWHDETGRPECPGPTADPGGNTIEELQTCPECRAGKCGNCDGGAWDRAEDKPCDCRCALRGHEPVRVGAA